MRQVGRDGGESKYIINKTLLSSTNSPYDVTQPFPLNIFFTGANAVYPGYGFLSENSDFAERCEQAGIVFIGPTAEAMRAFSQKHTARELAERVDIPIVPGTPLLSKVEDALPAARKIGFPVLLKASGGGGGIGIHICPNEAELVEKFHSASRQGAASFGDAGVFMEKYIEVGLYSKTAQRIGETVPTLFFR